MRDLVISMLALVAAASVFNITLAKPSGGETTTVENPYWGPIFRAANPNCDGIATEPTPQPQPLLDSEMTVAEQIEKLYSTATGDKVHGVDPAAYIKMDYWDVHWANKDPKHMGSEEQALNQPSFLDRMFEEQRMLHALAIQKAKLNLMFKSSRKPATGVRDFQAIRLGASLLPHETLATNINSYVPDGFTDKEIILMFKIDESLRTGERRLNATELAETNSLLLSLYLRALVGLDGPVEIEPTGEEAASECPICRDALNAEPSFHLDACGHKFHIDCVTNWIRDSIIMKCPLCRQRFRQSFDLAQSQ